MTKRLSGGCPCTRVSFRITLDNLLFKSVEPGIDLDLFAAGRVEGSAKLVRPILFDVGYDVLIEFGQGKFALCDL